MGNGNIYGKLVQGSGGGGISTGPNGGVGSLAWQNGGNSGIQPGASTIDPTLAAPDVTVPFTSASAPPALTLGTTNYAAVLDNGNYQAASLSEKVLVRGQAVLYVTGNVAITGAGFLQLAAGAWLELYVGGTSVTIQDVRMTAGSGTLLAVLGLPTVNSVSVDTGPGSPCFINAPSADFSLGGNGKFYGAVVCDHFSAGGNPSFDYDEAISAYLMEPRFGIVSWAER